MAMSTVASTLSATCFTNSDISACCFTVFRGYDLLNDIQDIPVDVLLRIVFRRLDRNVTAQAAQARNISIGRRASKLLRNIRNLRMCMGEKPIVSVTYENERI